MKATTTPKQANIEDVIAILPGPKDNIHGGTTLEELSDRLGVSKKIIHELILEELRKYSESRVNAWGDQDPSLTDRQFQKAALRYFKN